MKIENGIKEMIAERNNIEGDRESEESEETEQIFFEIEQQSWREVADIIATRGFIRGIKI